MRCVCWGAGHVLASYRPWSLALRPAREGLWSVWEHAHLDAHMGVVGICPRPEVFASSLGPQEVAQELGAVLKVVATHAPLPSLPTLQAGRVVTGAALHAPGTAGPGQSVGECGRRYRVQEGCLLETWAGHREDPGGRRRVGLETARGEQDEGAREPKDTAQASFHDTCPLSSDCKLLLCKWDFQIHCGVCA